LSSVKKSKDGVLNLLLALGANKNHQSLNLGYAQGASRHFKLFKYQLLCQTGNSRVKYLSNKVIDRLKASAVYFADWTFRDWQDIDSEVVC
jgi:hypothetical protein